MQCDESVSGRGETLDGDQRSRLFGNLFLHHVEPMLVGHDAPYHRRVLDDEVEWNRAECTDDADHRSEQSKAVKREGLHHAKHVHVDADAAEEGAHEVDDVGTWQREEHREDDVRRGKWHCAPRVNAQSEENLVFEWNDF